MASDNETVAEIVKELRDEPLAENGAKPWLHYLADRLEAAHKNDLRRQCEYLDKRYEEHMNSLIERHDAITDNLRKLIDPSTSKNADFVEAMNTVVSFADRTGVSLRDSDGGFTTNHLTDLFDSLLRLRRNHVYVVESLIKRMKCESDRAKDAYKCEIAAKNNEIAEKDGELKGLQKANDSIAADNDRLRREVEIVRNDRDEMYKSVQETIAKTRVWFDDYQHLKREVAELRECLRIIRDNLVMHTITSADGKYVSNCGFLSEEFVDDERWRKALEGANDESKREQRAG